MSLLSNKYGCLPAFGTLKPKALPKRETQLPLLTNVPFGAPPPIKAKHSKFNMPKFNIKVEDSSSTIPIINVDLQVALPFSKLADSSKKPYRQRIESHQTGVTAPSEVSQGEDQNPEPQNEPPKIKLGKRANVFES